MSRIMNWQHCQREFIRNVSEDPERMESLKSKAILRLKRAKNTDISSETVSFVVEDYYEVIKELLIVYLLKYKMRSRNHQCLISFFSKENPDLESEAILISQMSFFRNRLTYYGEDIPHSFYEKNKTNFNKIIQIILELIASTN